MCQDIVTEEGAMDMCVLSLLIGVHRQLDYLL